MIWRNQFIHTPIGSFDVIVLCARAWTILHRTTAHKVANDNYLLTRPIAGRTPLQEAEHAIYNAAMDKLDANTTSY